MMDGLVVVLLLGLGVLVALLPGLWLVRVFGSRNRPKKNTPWGGDLGQ